MNREIDLFYNMLKTGMPKDTLNMVNSTVLYDYGDYVEIQILAPSRYGDYARYVNYNQQRGPKEIKNYKYVERILRQWAETVGGNIDYELS